MDNALKGTLLRLGLVTILIAGAFVFVLNQGGQSEKEEKLGEVTFSLIDHNKSRVTHQDLKGHHSLVFFGFTNCPHICPMGMTKMTGMIRKMSKMFNINKMKFHLISVDPERDKPAVMKKFLDNFDERIVGLTGTETAIKEAAKGFKTYFAKQNPDDPHSDDITHSTAIYVVDPKLNVIGHIPNEMSTDESIKLLNEIIKGKFLTSASSF